MSTLFIFDIDHTCAHAGRRTAEAGPEPSRNDKAVYDVWLKNIQNEQSLKEDHVVPGMAALVNSVAKDNKVVFLTAREDKYRGVTRSWLVNKGFSELPLVMRPDTCYEDSAVFKEEHIKFLQGLYECSNVVVFDDDEHGTLESKCHGNGWTFLKARSGGQK